MQSGDDETGSRKWRRVYPLYLRSSPFNAKACDALVRFGPGEPFQQTWIWLSNLKKSRTRERKLAWPFEALLYTAQTGGESCIWVTLVLRVAAWVLEERQGIQKLELHGARLSASPSDITVRRSNISIGSGIRERHCPRGNQFCVTSATIAAGLVGLPQTRQNPIPNSHSRDHDHAIPDTAHPAHLRQLTQQHRPRSHRRPPLPPYAPYPPAAHRDARRLARGAGAGQRAEAGAGQATRGEEGRLGAGGRRQHPVPAAGQPVVARGELRHGAGPHHQRAGAGLRALLPRPGAPPQAQVHRRRLRPGRPPAAPRAPAAPPPPGPGAGGHGGGAAGRGRGARGRRFASGGLVGGGAGAAEDREGHDAPGHGEGRAAGAAGRLPVPGIEHVDRAHARAGRRAHHELQAGEPLAGVEAADEEEDPGTSEADDGQGQGEEGAEAICLTWV